MSSPLRILIGADTYPPDVNGAARFTERLATGLAARGHDVHVVAPSETGPPGRGARRPGHPTVHRVRSYAYPSQDRFRVTLPWRAAGATTDLLARLRPEVVHVQSHFSVGRGLAVAAHARAVPLVATNHFMPENLLDHAPVPAAAAGWVSRWAWRDLARVYGRADALTAPTPCAVRMLRERAGLPGGRAVSCGIDLERFTAGTEDPVPTVLFVGRLEQEKRVGELIAAFARVPGRARLEIVGDGSRRAGWAALARRLGVADRVRFRGVVDDEELVAAYRRAAVFAIPGVAELQSLVTLEAMAAGLPVVAADAVALPHLVRTGHNGVLYPPGDVDALAGALGALLGDPGARARMGAASRETVAAHALGSTLDEFEALYAAAAGTRVTRRAPVPERVAA